MTTTQKSSATVRSSVETRYADAARAPEAALCCPVDSDRTIDQHDWVYQNYMHPQMSGRT